MICVRCKIFHDTGFKCCPACREKSRIYANQAYKQNLKIRFKCEDCCKLVKRRNKLIKKKIVYVVPDISKICINGKIQISVPVPIKFKR